MNVVSCRYSRLSVELLLKMATVRHLGFVVRVFGTHANILCGAKFGWLEQSTK